MSTKRVKLPSATSVVARSWPDHVIGIENRLPWHLGTDLKLFRKRTEGHAIIMGRKTYESIGRPLPRRENIVLSRSPFPNSSGVRWAQNIETALLFADIFSICNFKKQFFVIGGENIYNSFERYINKVYLTEVFTRVNGDAKFSWGFPNEDWWSYKERDFPKSDSDDHPFRITTLVRRKPRHRYKTIERLLRDDASIANFLDRFSEMIETAEVHSPDEEQLLLL